MRATLDVVALLDHSDHVAGRLCPCGSEPVRDLAEPSRVAYLHLRPIPIVARRRPTPFVGGPQP